ncbi:type 1 glutamine amidotransferase [Dongia sp.]|uniref:type 1 glutamine amidotransferase n=1 Tax=Dongia sp. TaxID=1977262 RepID=UPI0035AF7154
MKRILIIVPELVAPPGILGQALVAQGVHYDTVFPVARFASYAPMDYPGLPQVPANYAGLIVMGGPMSAKDEHLYPFLTETMALVRAFTAADRPVLGVCLGAQIIAHAFGGDIYRMEKLESGFFQLNLTEEGAVDPLFQGIEQPVTVFENHYEATRNTPGAVPLVTGGACPIQAFRLGAKTYGVQFHIEVTIDIIRDWIRMFGTDFCRDEPRLLTDLDGEFARHFPAYVRACETLTRNWLALT